MQPPDWLMPMLKDERARLGFAVFAAVAVYLLAGVADAGRGGLVLLTGIPSALALIWWRTFPLRALALSVGGLAMTLGGVWNGFAANLGAILLGTTVVLPVLGASISSDRRLRWIGAGVVLLYAVVAGVGADAADGLLVLFAGSIPVLAGWGWREARVRYRLTGRLAESAEHTQSVERDVVIEQERNRVARDVHDVVAHSLAVVIAQADGARYAAEKDPTTVAPALDAIAETARAALGEVRTLLHELRHTQSATPSPGTGDLDTLIDGFRVLGLTVDVAHYGHQRALGDATQLAVYRVVQESLTNALRHGDTAQPVSVDFDWGDHALAVVITNALQGDGVPQVDGPGHGIPGMRERAALAGGDFTVGVGTRGMFRVRASLPASASPDAPTGVLARA